MLKRFALKTVAGFLGIALALCFLEALLRVRGFRPWTYERHNANEALHEPDPVLGWKSKKGNFMVGLSDPGSQPVEMTFLENGRRRTGVNLSTNTAGELVIVGCSFTQGHAINDSDTYAWKLQQKFPLLQVLNYGTAGYGSYQSLLMLERELPSLARPKFVLYGFIAHHEVRNAAPAYWLRLLSTYSPRRQVNVPFAIFDAEKGLVRYPPDHYVAFPFRESSALITFLEQEYMVLKTNWRLAQRRLSTEQILLQMNRVSEKYNSTFVVVLLGADDEVKKSYIKVLGANQIPVIDCIYSMTDEMEVPGEGHPNGKMNTLWAECISDNLADQFYDVR